MAFPTRSNGQTITAAWFNGVQEKIDKNIIWNPTTVTDATYTAADVYNLLEVDSSSNAVAITLPEIVAGVGGKTYAIKGIDLTNSVSVDGNGTDTIDGETAALDIENLNQVFVLIADEANSNWIIVSTAFDSTGGSGGGVGTPAIYGYVTPTDYNLGTWDVTNLSNASMSVITTGQLFGDSSYKIANATGAANEYVLGPSIALDDGNKQKVNSMEWTYTYDGTDDAVALIFEDVTNSREIDRVLLKSTSAPVRAIPEGWVDTDNVRVKILIITGEAADLVFDRGVFSDKPANEIGLLITESAHFGTVAGYGSTNTKIPHYTNEVANTTGAIVTVSNSTTNGLEITANRDCTVYIGVCAAFTASGNLGISLNSTQLTTGITGITAADRLAVGTGPSAGYTDHVSVTIEMKTGDVLRPHFDGGGLGFTDRHSVTISAIAESPAIVHASEGSVEEWTSYTPVTQGFGTISNVEVFYRRMGDSVEIRGRLTSGTPTASEVQIGLPVVNGSALAVASGLTNKVLVGNAARGLDGGDVAIFPIATGGDTYINIGIATSSANISDTPRDGTDFIGASQEFHFFATVPIEGWSGSYKSVITPLTETCYVNPHATTYYGTIVATTSYKKRNLDNLIGDSSWATILNDQLTIPAGKYELNIPVGSANGAQWVSLLIYDATNSVNFEELIDVVFSTAGSYAFNQVYSTIELSETTTFEFQTKSDVTTGAEYIGRIKIKKLL